MLRAVLAWEGLYRAAYGVWLFLGHTKVVRILGLLTLENWRWGCEDLMREELGELARSCSHWRGEVERADVVADEVGSWFRYIVAGETRHQVPI